MQSLLCFRISGGSIAPTSPKPDLNDSQSSHEVPFANGSTNGDYSDVNVSKGNLSGGAVSVSSASPTEEVEFSLIVSHFCNESKNLIFADSEWVWEKNWCRLRQLVLRQRFHWSPLVQRPRWQWQKVLLWRKWQRVLLGITQRLPVNPGPWLLTNLNTRAERIRAAATKLWAWSSLNFKSIKA